MGSTMIKAEGISKYYRLGTQGSGRFREDWNNWWKRRGTRVEEPHIWALRDVNFSIDRGEVVGLIGANGAGKSTLLRIISRITLPTTGRILGRGRIASLLEVGSGFHWELTGRENIYL